MKNYKIYFGLLIVISLGYFIFLKDSGGEEMSEMINFSYVQISKISILLLMGITLLEFIRIRIKPPRGIMFSNCLLFLTLIPIIIIYLTPLTVKYLSITKIQSGDQNVNWLLELTRNYINPTITLMAILFLLSQVALVVEIVFRIIKGHRLIDE